MIYFVHFMYSFWVKDKKKKYKFLSSGGILHISAKYQGGDIYKTSCWLTEEFDGGGKLTNVVQFQEVIEVLLMSEG